MPTDRPNILLITSDQQHFDTLGFSNPHIQTPALDRLAREGSHFTRAYCNNPVCTPSRASIITGLYAAWHGAWTIGVKLPEDVPTVGQVFSQQGYRTALVGKAHFQPVQSHPEIPAPGLGPDSTSIECQPTVRDLAFWRDFEKNHCPWYGFDHVETCRNHGDEAHVGGHYAIWMQEQGLTNWPDYFQDPDASTPRRHGTWDLPENMHYTPWTGQRTIAQIDQAIHDDQPFFIWSSFHDPHPPYLVPEPWASMYDPADMPIGHLHPGELDKMPPPHQMTQQDDADWQPFCETPYANHGYMRHGESESQIRQNMAIYYGMTSFMDHHIGRILDHLDAQGMADNTLVVFTTDHGHYLGHHGLTAKGAFHYEDGIRLPFLVRHPGHVPAGATNTAIQSLVDLAPTFLDTAHLDIPGLMQGVSQKNCWATGQPARDHAICEFRHQPTAVHLRTFINERYKLTLYRGRDWGELFDLQQDPGEVDNKFNDPAYANVKAQLMEQWLQAEIAREPTRMPRVAQA